MPDSAAADSRQFCESVEAGKMCPEDCDVLQHLMAQSMHRQ